MERAGRDKGLFEKSLERRQVDNRKGVRKWIWDNLGCECQIKKETPSYIEITSSFFFVLIETSWW